MLGVQSTAMTPVFVTRESVLITGTTPTKGVMGYAARRSANACTEAVLQATTMSFAPISMSRPLTSRARRRSTSSGLSP